jgi:hypothetical protein
MPRRKLDPLPSSAFRILLARADGEKHGYAIMRDIAEETDNKVRLGPGTLYGSIQTLLDADCVGESARACFREAGNADSCCRSGARPLAASGHDRLRRGEGTFWPVAVVTLHPGRR